MRRFVSGYEVLHSSREWKGSWVGVGGGGTHSKRPVLLGTVLCSRELCWPGITRLTGGGLRLEGTLLPPGSGLSAMIPFYLFAFYFLSNRGYAL